MRSLHAQSLPVHSYRLILTSYQNPHLRHSRQMRGIQASDRSTPDDAYSLHPTRLTSSLHFHQLRHLAHLSLERTKQAVGIVEGILDEDSPIKEGVL
jgi:hypothetical protein